MKRLQIAFLLNPLDEMKINEDTSFSIMAECDRRHHSIYFLESKNLILIKNRLHAHLTKCRANIRQGIRLENRRFIDLRRLDCLWIRKEPPFNEDYLACTYMLDFLRPYVFLINDSAGIRNVNEKMSALNFPELTPKSVVGFDEKELIRQVRSLRMKRIVLKRMDNKGGVGILRGSLNDTALNNKIKILSNASKNPIQIQEYIDHRTAGDKRILILNGKPLGSFTRLPSSREFRANMSLGAQAAPANLTSRDRSIVLRLEPYLKKNGLHFVGIDILDGYLTEINVTSPAGIPEINGFDGTHLEGEVVDYVERRV